MKAFCLLCEQQYSPNRVCPECGCCIVCHTWIARTYGSCIEGFTRAHIGSIEEVRDASRTDARTDCCDRQYDLWQELE